MNWLEVSMQLEADLAEPAADLLSRVAPNGVAIEMKDEIVRVRAWLPEDEQLPDRRRRIDEGLWHLSQIQPLPEPAFRLVEEEPWEHVWKEQYQALEVGERLQVLPSWMDRTDDSRLPIYLEPGMAFGTGAHTTTRHCLEALEHLVSPGDLVADIGCGSGILAIAAARLGAGEVLAIDTDTQAVQLAEENAERNEVADRIEVVQGSIPELADFPRRRLILANIRASVLEGFLEAGVGHYLTSDGRVVMSGILEDQLNSLLKAGKADGLHVDKILSTADWRSVIFSRR